MGGSSPGGVKNWRNLARQRHPIHTPISSDRDVPPCEPAVLWLVRTRTPATPLPDVTGPDGAAGQLDDGRTGIRRRPTRTSGGRKFAVGS